MLLSVIIPVYNAEKTIEQCLQSVIDSCTVAITVSDFEVIVIDDGSSDNSATLLDKFAKDDTRVKIIHQKNNGVSAARNAGLEIAAGEFIAFNDADDIWLPGKINKQLSLFEKYPDADCILANYGTDRLRTGDVYKIKFKNQLFKNYFSPPTIIVKRSALRGLKFPDGQNYMEDALFGFNLLRQASVYYLNEKVAASILNKKRYGQSGQSRHLWLMEKAELKNLHYVRKNQNITSSFFVCAVCYSLLKYIRRLLICFFR